jgi:hypothetical protein
MTEMGATYHKKYQHFDHFTRKMLRNFNVMMASVCDAEHKF